MCILRVPQHPWCWCPDPSAVDKHGHLTCPHHVWVRPDSAHVVCLPQNAQAHLAESLAAIHRPGSSWVHCAAYCAAHSPNIGQPPFPGFELACPGTRRGRDGKPDPVKDIFMWDGLCKHCQIPGRGVPLELVPLRHRFGMEEETGGGRRYRNPWAELVPIGLAMPDGSPVEDTLENRLIDKRGRSARDGGEGVYVHVVQGRLMGRQEVDTTLSAVYLLPDVGYDPFIVPGEEQKPNETAGKWPVVEAVKYMVGKMFAFGGLGDRYGPGPC